MKGKNIATGRAQAEELDPLHAARTTSMGRDRGSESNPLSLEEFRQLRMQGDFAPYWVKIGEKVYFASYGKELLHARQVCPFIEHGIRQCQENH